MALTDPGKGLNVMIFGNACGKGIAAAKTWAGAILGQITSGKYPLAVAVTTGIKHARFVAGSAAEADAEVELAPMAIVTGYSGGTPGNYVYVKEGSPGYVLDSIALTGGSSKKRIGLVLAADTLFLCPLLFDLDDPTV